MRLSWKRKARQIDSWPVSTKALELKTAKEILSEVFHARPADVEEMIQSRLEEMNRYEEREDGLWPATFCLGESLWAGALRAYAWA